MAIMIGPSEVSTLRARVSPLNGWVILLCFMFGLIRMATPEAFVAVLCMYVMYGGNLMGFLGGKMLVCANSMMSGLILM